MTTHCNNMQEFLFNANSQALNGNFGFYAELPATQAVELKSWGFNQDLQFDRRVSGDMEIYYISWDTPFSSNGWLTAKCTKEQTEYIIIRKVMGKPCEFPPCDTIGQQLFIMAMANR